MIQRRSRGYARTNSEERTFISPAQVYQATSCTDRKSETVTRPGRLIQTESLSCLTRVAQCHHQSGLVYESRKSGITYHDSGNLQPVNEPVNDNIRSYSGAPHATKDNLLDLPIDGYSLSVLRRQRVQEKFGGAVNCSEHS